MTSVIALRVPAFDRARPVELPGVAGVGLDTDRFLAGAEGHRRKLAAELPPLAPRRQRQPHPAGNRELPFRSSAYFASACLTCRH